MNRRDTFSPVAIVCRLAAVASAAAVAVAATLLFSGGSGLEAQAPGPCDPPNGNPVVCENQKAGNVPAEWDISGAGDSTIQGFATDISVNRGQTVSFKIKTTVSTYRLDIYRMGYYGGLGARKVATVNRTGAVQTQPNCLSDAATGLIDCGNWTVSTSWAVPADAVSGIYFAKVVRPDTGGASHIPFVVRDDVSTADVFFQTSDTTWQAYNQYGGNSLYVGAPATNPNRAYKVSYNRPITTRATSPEDFMFNAEYPMVRWLEANGYNVAYTSGIDTDRSGARIRQHKTFLSVGHDEYWSAAQRTNVEAARAAGVHLAFFSGNEVFWKTRYENSISTPATAYRTLVSYKETHANAKIDPQASIWTGAWEDPRFSPPADGNRPSNSLTGTLFRVNSGTAAIRVPAADGKMRFWRNTTVANLTPNTVATLAEDTLGFEWDEDVQNAFRPAGLIRLSETAVSGVERLQDYGSTYQSGTANHSLTFYRHASGALVFGAGTVQWAWGLDSNHDRGAGEASVDMQQATINLLADMGVQPLTIQSGLFTAAKSTDVAAPTSVITSPTSGTQPANSTITVTGTAFDNGGGQVGGVEVSVDNGVTWRRATGRNNWSYSWQTGAPRTVTLRSRAADDSGNIETPASGTTVTLGNVPVTCPCSIWSSNQSPASGSDEDANAVTLGARFRSDLAGYVTAIRFYKSFQDMGPHVGSLWTDSGAQLANVTFANETASGWQEAVLATPVAISANTTYVVSYHTDFGYYIGDDNYFATTGIDNGPLHAPADGAYGDNGVYKYGANGFPSSTYGSENYWADVVFQTVVAPDTTAPVVSSVTPSNGATEVASTTAVAATFNEAMNAATITGSTVELRNSSGTLVTSSVTYSATTRTVTLQPGAALAYSSTYTATVKGGSSGVKDAANNALAGNFAWSFTTAAPPAPPPTTGPGGPVLVISATANPFTQYYAEILRAEGLNAFNVTDLTAITATVLNNYDVVILGEMPLTTAQVTMLSNWVTAGGNLIAMRPDKKLATLSGLLDAGTTLADAYLQVNTAAAPGAGIVGQTIQFHGTADKYTISGATAVATLFSTAAAATPNPAVTIRSVGSAGGQVAAFTYDLARSVVYTRQGNPAWAGLERDGQLPRRSDDLFFGGTQADYVDLTKVAIPQADEQQRLLANLIGFMNDDRKPLPKFWYLPRGLKAAVVMTGDDHSNNGTQGRFDIYNNISTPGCRVDNWECIRATSYIFASTPIPASAVAGFAAQGFEIGVHMWMSGQDTGEASGTTICNNFTTASITADYSKQLALFGSLFPSALPVRSNRTHCIVWSDYTTQAQVALANGIRLDTNYYYWPASWVNDVPGLFTGSGMPMRFAKTDGTLIDVYQAASQMTDESEQSYPLTVNTLLDRALGPEGYYGAFVANMHTDTAVHAGSEAIVASAQARGVPIISAKQLLTWLDGRNGSSFGSITWNGSALGFTVSTAAGATDLQALLPVAFGARTLTGLSRNGAPVNYSTLTIKGVSYAAFASSAGPYLAQYSVDAAAPVISAVNAVPGTGSADVSWTTNEAATTRVDFGTTADVLNQSATVAGLTTAHSVRLAGLNGSTTYYFRVTSADGAGNSATQPTAPAPPATFTTVTAPGLNCPCTIWPASTVPPTPSVTDANAVELGVKVRSSIDGFITGIRFYKGAGNVGPHVGSLWTAAGTRLGTLTFANETATGWQEASLVPPVAITANTTYVASYHTDSGLYAGDGGFFQSAAVTNGPLTALANGTDGPNGLYKYGASSFPNSSFNGANYWVDVVFNTSIVADVTPPSLIASTPANGSGSATPTTAVTATFSEDLNPATVTTATVELRDSANTLVPGTVTYVPATRTATLQPTGVLAASTTYTGRVRGGAAGIKDLSGNAMTVDATWSFTTGAPTQFTVTDTTVAQFSAGALDEGSYIAQTGDGELSLAPAVGAEFSDAALPAGWSNTTWTDGGTALVGAGQIVVDGSRVSVDAVGGANRSLEFTATFSADAFAHIGFGLTFNETPWAMFGTAGGGGIYARSHDGSASTDTLIPGNWIGTPHRYRIDWKSAAVEYFIDGNQVASHPVAIAATMRPIISDYLVGGGTVKVDWLRVTPYATSGTFTSRIIDAGLPIDWSSASWTATVPTLTTLAVSARFGPTPIPDASWTGFQTLATGTAVGQSSRYLQYRSVFGGAGDSSPVLQDITFAGAAPISSLAVSDVTLTEGDTGSQNAVFTVTVSPAASTSVSVGYATANGTATAGTDYTAVSGTLIIPAGTASMNIAVPVAGDAIVEGNETFVLNLSSASNATLGDAQGVATIVNDDTALLSVGNASVTEGNTGSPVTATFTVSLSTPSSQTVTVNYATNNGSAGASDFTAKSGTLTFAPGVVTQAIPVITLGDVIDEDDETFTVTLSAAVNAAIAAGQGTGTIVDNDAAPSLSINNLTVTEGNSGVLNAVLTASLSTASGRAVTVDFATANGTAAAPGDYITTSGPLTFAAGSTSQSITIPIVGDVLDEPNETVLVNLTNPVNATIADSQGIVTITDNDAATASLAISDATVTEGNAGTVNAVFTVTLTGQTGQTVTVNYATAAGTASGAANDYAAVGGTLTFAPGVAVQTVIVSVIGDTVDEGASETFSVNLSGAVNASIADASGLGTIADDDDPVPTLAIGNATVVEGNTGTVNALFTVTRAGITTQTTTVNYATAAGTAAATTDYTSAAGTLTFAPGVTSQQVTVAVKGDTLDEANETFAVNLTGAINGSVSDAQGIGTITDDDAPPSVVINNASITEGNSGTKTLTFTLTLSAVSGQTASVSYATANGTAVGGTFSGDFTTASGSVSFAAGATTASVTISIRGDTTREADETFLVNLTNPVNVIIADNQGLGTIVNDD